MNSGNLILLVEDSEEDILLFTDALNRSGLGNPVRVVRDGVEAIAYLTGQVPFSDRKSFPPPKVLLLDLTLPKMSGWEVLQWVRSNPQFKGLLVVVLTASLMATDLQRAYQMGANSFLAKPCRPEELQNLARGFPEHWSGARDASRKTNGGADGRSRLTLL